MPGLCSLLYRSAETASDIVEPLLRLTFRPCPWNIADEFASELLENDTPRKLPTGIS